MATFREEARCYCRRHRRGPRARGGRPVSLGFAPCRGCGLRSGKAARGQTRSRHRRSSPGPRGPRVPSAAAGCPQTRPRKRPTSDFERELRSLNKTEHTWMTAEHSWLFKHFAHRREDGDHCCTLPSKVGQHDTLSVCPSQQAGSVQPTQQIQK